MLGGTFIRFWIYGCDCIYRTSLCVVYLIRNSYDFKHRYFYLSGLLVKIRICRSIPNLRSVYHSHSISISSFEDDVSFAKQISKNQASNKFYLPSFFIYHVPSKQHRKYYPAK